MSGDIPAELEQGLQSLDDELGKIEEQLRPLLSMPLEAACGDLAPVEKAQLHVAVGYAINTLFYVYLRLQGISINDHPIRGEIDRIRSYVEKVERLAGEPSQRSTIVNKEATRRVVAAALGFGSEKADGEADGAAASPQKRKKKKKGEKKKRKKTKK